LEEDFAVRQWPSWGPHTFLQLGCFKIFSEGMVKAMLQMGPHEVEQRRMDLNGLECD